MEAAIRSHRSQFPPPRARQLTEFAPVFVLATARSYSSVVTMMIGQHPELVGLPELKLFGYATVGELEDSLPQFWRERGFKHRSPGLVRALAEVELGGQSVASLEAARAWLRQRRGWRGEEVLDVLLRRLAPREAVEKSPENALTDAALQRILAAYPRARFLHLTRHPITTQQSIREHFRRTVPGYPPTNEGTFGIQSWYEINRRILLFAALLPTGRYRQFRAEDILNDSDRVLREIAEWLRVRTDETAVQSMKHPQDSPFSCLGPAESGVIGGNDHGFLRDPVPHRVPIANDLARPASWDAGETTWGLVVDLAARLGYSREGDGTA